MSTAIVYGAKVDHLGARAGEEQPAYRAWADALLHQTALSSKRELATSILTRSTSRIGRLVPEGLYGEPVEVEVESCSLALASDNLELFFPLAWSDGLFEFLVDRGHGRDMLEEHLLPCVEPLAPIVVERMSEALKYTSPDLVTAIIEFFSVDFESYLSSWRPLSVGASEKWREWEVVIPYGAGLSTGRTVAH